MLAGRRALILGVANDHSIAWGIAKAFAAHGAELAITHQGEGFERRVVPLAESVGGYERERARETAVLLDVRLSNRGVGLDEMCD